MGRRAKPTKVKAEAERPLVRKSPKDHGARVRDLEQRLAEGGRFFHALARDSMRRSDREPTSHKSARTS